MKRKLLNSWLRPLGYRLEPTLRGPTTDRRLPVHFLHLGKCGGTAIGSLVPSINRMQATYRVIRQGHHTFLRDLPVDDAYFFSIRDPMTRFVSGFYSRKREGWPRTVSPWNSYERAAFATFDHATDLAEALFRTDQVGIAARGAIKAIEHTAMDQVQWFYGAGNFLEVRPPLFIIRQEHLTSDLDVLCERMGVEEKLTPATDEITSHRNEYRGVPCLSDTATANLRNWYAQDIWFYDMCARWIVAHGGVSADTEGASGITAHE